MSDFRFANPNGVHALWLVLAVVALLFWLDRRGRRAVDRFLSVTMQARLSRNLPARRRWSSIVLLGLAGMALAVAAMRPQWGLTYVQTPRVGAQIMVCLDVSNSMLAEDTAPNRLERAKAELSDLLGYLDGDQVGLIAFAGRATVLCPLTPDFGFFKLILDGAGPTSVGRGGTRLEEPIRKATAGFRTETDVSRAILLVTDGEDHDSFPLEAAKDAAERGIKIITIGFGDEAGSEIQITEPQTGVRSVLQDSSGQPVVTRLDGETLRQIAQLTAGAYVPAGTGALDLKSIYDVHIQPLTRGRLDDRGHAIRHEGFQWAVLAGLLLLVGSVVAASGSSAARAPSAMPAPSSARSGVSLAVTVWLACATILSLLGPGASRPASAQEPSEQPVDPRAAYNAALACLDSDPEQAEQLFTTARRESRADGETRFRSTYNLGWVEVKRADQLLVDKPADALQHLQQAANWFRDAIRLRPESTAARQNLELVLRREMELADSLRPKEQRDLSQRLDDLIVAQRGLMATTSGLLQQLEADSDSNAADRFRDDFRQLKLEQARILAENQAAFRTAREELDSLQGKPAEEQQPQTQLRASQLANVLHYADRASQRMGQARSQMRRAQGARAFRRASAALEELKRARDQLRDPPAVLSVILGDAGALAGLTRSAAASRSIVPFAGEPPSTAPAWLTREYLEETQTSLTERTDELTTRLKAAVDQQGQKPIGPRPADQPTDQEAGLQILRDAMPFLTQGTEAFRAAQTLLATDDLAQANARQIEGIQALQAARERFLDLRGLIELTHGAESQIQALLTPTHNQPHAAQADEGTSEADSTANSSPTDPVATEPAPTDSEVAVASARLAAVLQNENVARSARLARMLEHQPDTTAPENGTDDSARQAAQTEQRRRDIAQKLLEDARREMQHAVESLGASGIDEPHATPAAEEVPPEPPTQDVLVTPQSRAAVDATRPHVDRAVEHLHELRRLYFSVVEHLQETVQRQTQLNDETEQLAVVADPSPNQPKLGPLVQRQQDLTDTAGQIAAALREQAQPSAPSADPQPADPQATDPQAEEAAQFSKAAELVSAGEVEMKLGTESLRGDAPAWKLARQHQDTALEKLNAALALFAPPQQQNHDQQSSKSSQDQNQNQNQESAQQAVESQQKQDQEAQGTDPARLLQAVRDREARRRRDRTQRQHADRQAVEKDW